jgi:hypothetical protein
VRQRDPSDLFLLPNIFENRGGRDYREGGVLSEITYQVDLPATNLYLDKIFHQIYNYSHPEY